MWRRESFLRLLTAIMAKERLSIHLVPESFMDFIVNISMKIERVMRSTAKNRRHWLKDVGAISRRILLKHCKQ